jgi:DNA-binding IscR family transcriptional regulator
MPDVDDPTMTTTAAAATLRAAVLRALTEVSEPGWCLNLSGLAVRTGLSRDLLRGLVADLRREGLVEHQRGLWFEDGTPAGAGYSLTAAGYAALDGANA